MPTSTAPRTTTASTASWRRLMFSTSIGTAIEMYDFFIYGTAAALVFHDLFFPTSNYLTGILLAFATYGVGFLARPIGGAVFGHFGDRLGRKRMLVTSLLVMGIATFAIGLLPTYQQVGLLAPLLLVVLRLAQGFSAGGEWAGAVLTAVEQAPPGRAGLYGSWTMMGSPIGLILATAAFQLLGNGMSDAAFESWGWRIPFLASAVLVVIGMYIRLGVRESAEFNELRDSGRVHRAPIAHLLRNQWRALVLGAGVNVGFNAFIYLIFTFALSIASEELGVAVSTILTGTLVGAAAQIVTVLAAARLSDSVGRTPVMMTGAVFLLVWCFVHFSVLAGGNDTLALVSMTVAFAGSGLLLGPMGAYFAELFGTSVRYTGAALGYQLGAVFGGGLAPFVATALYAANDKRLLPVAVYGASAAAITILSIAVLWRSSAGATSARNDNTR